MTCRARGFRASAAQPRVATIAYWAREMLPVLDAVPEATVVPVTWRTPQLVSVPILGGIAEQTHVPSEGVEGRAPRAV